MSRRRGGACVVTLALLFAPPSLDAQDADAPASDHVPPAAASQPMPPMTPQEMDRVMDMHDDPLLAMFKLDQLEHAYGDGDGATQWEAEAWIGHDFDKLWLRSEGEHESGTTDARVEAFWDHAFASWWDWQLGIRHDFGDGPSRPLSAIDGLRGSLSAIHGLRDTSAPAGRTQAPARRDWAAFGVQGLAPYWFEIEATAYLGQSGRTAFRARAEYELLLTQRLILQPELEANLYGKSDPQRGVSDGLSDASVGLRLRYEIRREIAPYVGVVWKRHFGDAAFAPGGESAQTQFVAGLRVWF